MEVLQLRGLPQVHLSHPFLQSPSQSVNPRGTCNVSASGVGADHAGAAGGIKNTAIESVTRQVSLTSVVGIAIATFKL